jgi:putative membrane protein
MRFSPVFDRYEACRRRHAMKRLLDDAGKARIKAAVQKLEATSSAEIVVAVHPRSASHRQAEWIAGAVFASAWLLVFLYYPEPFDFTFLPLELVGAFVAGALLSFAVPPWRRLVTSRRSRELEVHRSAKSAFVDLGVSRTRARTGILVFASVFEGRALIVRDVGVPSLPKLADIEARLSSSLRKGDAGEFARSIEELREPLSLAMPRSADDTNELADEVAEAA